MEIIWKTGPMETCVLVLGMFDGVHRGHQELLMLGAEKAQAKKIPLVVWTFEPHPLEVLCPSRAPKRLTTLQERADFMAGYGVDRLCVTAFTLDIANTDPQVFLDRVTEIFHPACVICGFNYSFGQGGRGKPEELKAYGEAHGIDVAVVPPVEIAGDTVSSTRIRLLLEAGDLRLATRLLGHAYALSGRVMDGKHIGRTLGFPTANVACPAEKELPAFGVYVGYLKAKGERSRECVINIGRHPTLPEGSVTVEAHVLKEHPDLYGKDVTVTLMDFLRPETKFASVEDLREQVDRDRQQAAAWFRAHGS